MKKQGKIIIFVVILLVIVIGIVTIVNINNNKERKVNDYCNKYGLYGNFVYNNKIGLEETIKSMISQSYKNFEYIVIDGASTDGTLDIITKYNQYITTYISEPDKGIYDAMNKGIDLAKKIFKLDAQGVPVLQIAKECEISVEKVTEILEK